MIYVCANGNFRKAVVLHVNVLSRPNVITQNHPFVSQYQVFNQKKALQNPCNTATVTSQYVWTAESRGNKQTLLHSDVKCQQGQVPKMTVKKMNRTAAEHPDNFIRPVISVSPQTALQPPPGVWTASFQTCTANHLSGLPYRENTNICLAELNLKLVAKTFSFSGLQKPEGEEQRYLQDDQKQIHRTSDPRASVTKMKTTKDLLMHDQIAKHLWDSGVFVHV